MLQESLFFKYLKSCTRLNQFQIFVLSRLAHAISGNLRPLTCCMLTLKVKNKMQRFNYHVNFYFPFPFLFFFAIKKNFLHLMYACKQPTSSPPICIYLISSSNFEHHLIIYASASYFCHLWLYCTKLKR